LAAAVENRSCDDDAVQVLCGYSALCGWNKPSRVQMS
jgi:formylmethanofuran dehydrogenase subunit E